MIGRYERSWVSLLHDVGDDYPPVTRAEGRGATLFLLLPLQVLWFFALMAGAEPLFGLSSFQASVLVPAGILAGGFLAGGLVAPTIWLRPLRLEPYVVSIRRRGRLGRWDATLILAGAIAAIGVFVGGEAPGSATAGLVLLHALVVLRLVGSGPAEVEAESRWEFTIPDWLKTTGADSKDGGGPDETSGVMGPARDAHPIYEFDTREGDRYPVGVKISKQLLQAMRAMNASSKGVLYHDYPEAVVLGSGAPVGKLGTEELTRLACQISSVAAQHGWTRLQTANRVLEFVQEVVTYEHDDVSTDSFEGGPFEEYGRFALETVWDGVGDCECTAILCSALLAYMGFETALLFVHVPGSHVGVGLRYDAVLGSDEVPLESLLTIRGDDGDTYIYGETAVEGRIFGFGTDSWEGQLQLERLHPIRSVNGNLQRCDNTVY